MLSNGISIALAQELILSNQFEPPAAFARRRTSSEKFSIKRMWLCDIYALVVSGSMSAATRLPSGATS
jgi:hypothetical protein